MTNSRNGEYKFNSKNGKSKMPMKNRPGGLLIGEVKWSGMKFKNSKNQFLG